MGCGPWAVGRGLWAGLIWRCQFWKQARVEQLHREVQEEKAAMVKKKIKQADDALD